MADLAEFEKTKGDCQLVLRALWMHWLAWIISVSAVVYVPQRQGSSC